MRLRQVIDGLSTPKTSTCNSWWGPQSPQHLDADRVYGSGRGPGRYEDPVDHSDLE